MFTKEELLQKGVSEEAADEIIASFNEGASDEDSLLALSKALEGPDANLDLSKAKGEKKSEKEPDDDDDDKDDYDEKYMKKHMVRYMKENKSSAKKGMKDAGLFADDMQKAIDDLNLDAGGVVEYNDLSKFVHGQISFNAEMLKAIELMAGQNDVITNKVEQSFALMQKAAKAIVDQATLVKGFMGTSVGKKGVIVDARLNKAGTGVDDLANVFTAEDNKKAYEVLFKATKEGNSDAGLVISAFEVSGKNANRLKDAHKNFIRSLIAKEAN